MDIGESASAACQALLKQQSLAAFGQDRRSGEAEQLCTLHTVTSLRLFEGHASQHRGLHDGPDQQFPVGCGLSRLAALCLELLPTSAASAAHPHGPAAGATGPRLRARSATRSWHRVLLRLLSSARSRRCWTSCSLESSRSLWRGENNGLSALSPSRSHSQLSRSFSPSPLSQLSARSLLVEALDLRSERRPEENEPRPWPLADARREPSRAERGAERREIERFLALLSFSRLVFVSSSVLLRRGGASALWPSSTRRSGTCRHTSKRTSTLGGKSLDSTRARAGVGRNVPGIHGTAGSTRTNNGKPPQGLCYVFFLCAPPAVLLLFSFFQEIARIIIMMLLGGRSLPFLPYPILKHNKYYSWRGGCAKEKIIMIPVGWRAKKK